MKYCTACHNFLPCMECQPLQINTFKRKRNTAWWCQVTSERRIIARRTGDYMKYRLSIVIHDMKYKRKSCPLTSVVGQRLRRRKSSENPPRTTSRLTPATARLCRTSHSPRSALALEVGFTSRLLSRCESLRLSFYRERGGGVISVSSVPASSSPSSCSSHAIGRSTQTCAPAPDPSRR